MTRIPGEDFGQLWVGLFGVVCILNFCSIIICFLTKIMNRRNNKSAIKSVLIVSRSFKWRSQNLNHKGDINSNRHDINTSACNNMWNRTKNDDDRDDQIVIMIVFIIGLSSGQVLRSSKTKYIPKSSANAVVVVSVAGLVTVVVEHWPSTKSP